MKVDMEFSEKMLLLKERGYDIKIIQPGHVEIWKGDAILGNTKRGGGFVAPHLDVQRELSDPTYFPMRKKFMQDMEELDISHLADGSKQSSNLLVELIEQVYKKKTIEEFGADMASIKPGTLMRPSRQ